MTNWNLFALSFTNGSIDSWKQNRIYPKQYSMKLNLIQTEINFHYFYLRQSFVLPLLTSIWQDSLTLLSGKVFVNDSVFPLFRSGLKCQVVMAWYHSINCFTSGCIQSYCTSSIFSDRKCKMTCILSRLKSPDANTTLLEAFSLPCF